MRYAYCPPIALTLDYRKQLLLDELLGYDADVICLQEVDCKAFERYYMPFLRNRSFKGSMCTKATTVSQGVATFYNSNTFE